jgi:hypothetical protein
MDVHTILRRIAPRNHRERLFPLAGRNPFRQRRWWRILQIGLLLPAYLPVRWGQFMNVMDVCEELEGPPPTTNCLRPVTEDSWTAIPGTKIERQTVASRAAGSEHAYVEASRRPVAPGNAEDAEFETKPRDGDAGAGVRGGVPFAWVTADEAYGQVKYLRTNLDQHDYEARLKSEV